MSTTRTICTAQDLMKGRAAGVICHSMERDSAGVWRLVAIIRESAGRIVRQYI